MNERTEIARLLAEPPLGKVITVNGWVRAFRSRLLIVLHDGSSCHNRQWVV